MELNTILNCQNDRIEELNSRINDRNKPSEVLPMNYDPRPISTKYSKMAVLDHRKTNDVPLSNNASVPYSIENTFNPGNDRGHWSGYTQNINIESNLRNQYKLNGCDEKKEYIPNENSDLYRAQLPSHNSNTQPHKLLFHKPTFDLSDPNNCNLGMNLFHNHTRQQRMDL